MAVSLGDAILWLKSDSSELDKGLTGAETKTEGFIGKAGKLLATGLVTGAAAAGAALVGVGVAGVKSFISFEEKMNEVFTLLPGISKEAMNDMNEQVKQFSKDFGVLPEQVVPALYQALSAGVPPDNVFKFLEVANKAAVGGVTSLETAVDGITSVVNAYGEEMIDASKASDLMFTAVKLGKTDFTQLSQSLFNVIPTAASTGVAFEDITAALAALTAQGTPTSVATTQMRQLLVELSSAGGKASTIFEEMAGKSFVDFVAEGGNVQGALALMEQAAEKNEVRLSDLFSSVEAGNAALGLTGQGAQTFANNLAEMGNATGATEAAFQQMDSGIGKSIDKIKAAWAVMILDIGTKLAPAIETVVNFAVEMMPKFTSAFRTAFDYLDTAVTFVTGVFRGVTEFLKGDFSGTMEGAAGKFDFIREKIDEIMPYIQTLIENVLRAITTFWKNHGETVMHVVTNAFKVVSTIIVGTMSVILDVIKLALQILTGDWSGAWETMGSILGTIWDTINTVIGLKLDTLGSIFTAIFPILTGAWETFGAWWENGVSGTTERVQGLFGTFRGWLEESTSSMLGNIRSWWQGQSDDTKEIVESQWHAIRLLWETGEGALQDIHRAGMQILQGDWQGGLDTLKGTVSWVWDDIKDIFRRQLDEISRIIFGMDFAAAGERIINSLRRGIENKWDELKNWWKRKLEDLRNMLPFSEPKDPSSPLRNLDKAGEGLIEQVQLGLERSGFSSGFLKPLAGAAAGAGGMGAVSIVQNFYGPTDAEAVRQASESGLRSAFRQRGMA